MKNRTLALLSAAAVALALAWPGLAGAQEEDDYTPPEPELSDSETSFTGAVMLVGNEDASIGQVTAGSVGEADDARYAFFVGNTLYAGVEGADGNTVDLIGEFFWFESSLDRGSDFYVGVFKVRTSPALLDGWRLEKGDDPVLYMHADTDLGLQAGSFRWDWSIPFESYGWDSYGSVTMETEYGLGIDAEGSVLSAAGVDENGVEVSGQVQSKGYLNSEYSVRTQYQVTLWRWEVLVQGSAGSMEWEMLLNADDRDDQNAYHEFFLVMQAEEDEPFFVDNLEFGGSVRDPSFMWFDTHSQLSASIPALVLQRPAIPEPPVEPEEDEDDEEDDDSWWPGGDGEDDWWSDGEEETEEPEPEEEAEWSETGSGCSVAASNSSPWLALVVLSLVGALRRKLH